MGLASRFTPHSSKRADDFVITPPPSYLKLHPAESETDFTIQAGVATDQQIKQTELAAQAAGILRDSIAKQGSEQINQILADAVLATGSVSAVIYMLDEATEVLTTRFVFGMPARDRLGAARPLRGARGDLEAMVQGSHTIEGLAASSVSQTSAPESFTSAHCICLGGTDLPIGTMWFFSNEPATYDDQTKAAARLAAANVCQLLVSFNHTDAPVPEQRLDDAVETDFDVEQFVEAMEPLPPCAPAIGGGVPFETKDWSHQIADWQFDTLPVGSRLAPGWAIDGMVESPLSVAQSWHHWDVLPDGVLALSMCQFGHDWNPAGNLVDTLDATVARAALQAHMGYRHTPQDALVRILHSMLQVRDGAIDESGCPNLSLLYAHVDPETGHAVISSIGQWSSLIVSKQGYRPLGLGRTSGSVSEGFPAELPIMNHETTLLAGEALLVTGAEWMGMGEAGRGPESSRAVLPRSDARHHDRESTQHQVGAALKQALSEGERSPLAALRRFTASLPLTQERSAVALLRESTR
ncbi:hypothetical protein Poly21_28800 [Allorhodopirellula heiligendammensis]|uniref:Stage II sporulation protein E (SpoIIE) n=1 Tax=Allorhodopirellula heiligendammensis TaxID=2714739 RepID=A0A5C6BTX6_9BACT|nr:hypothetical protein Poly21_28800 [Allorhodopirellula heiligendammensis]